MKYLKKFIICFSILIFCFLLLGLTIPIKELPNQIDYKDEESIFYNFADHSFMHYKYFPANGDKVVTFIHGFGGSTHDWSNQIEFLSDKGYSVILVDLLGFGRSSKNYEDDYSHRAQSKRLNEILNSLNIKKTFLVGHSMGGNVALNFATMFPDSVESLILVAPAIVKTETNKIEIFSSPIIRRIFALIMSHYIDEDRIKSILKTAVYDSNIISDKLVVDFSEAISTYGWWNGLMGVIRDSSSNKVDIDLNSIGSKISFIWGSNDEWVPLNTEFNQSLIKNQKLIVIQNSGHLPMIEKSFEFNTALIEIIK
jgi:pimeloyl-ACP methyl ester carboxylesterase